jgi:hypothetical protein
VRPVAARPAPQRLVWEATPPPGTDRPAVARRPARPYTGPPAYRAVPRWGFPRLAWRQSTSVPGTPTRPAPTQQTVLSVARAMLPVLWVLVLSCAVATVGEVSRYTLLVLGRDRALPGALVAWSDGLVNVGSVVSLALGLLALVLGLRWLFAIRRVAADLSGFAPARPDWAVALGMLLPGLNLFVAGSVLAELEHTAGRPEHRVRPSRLVLAWWLVWAGGEVVAVLTVLLGLRAGVQAQADGVLWHGVADLLGVALAVLTIRVIGSLDRMIAPSDPAGFRLTTVLRVAADAPAPAAHPRRPIGSPR